MSDRTFWRWLVGILLVPAITVVVALGALFSRVGAVEQRLNDAPTRVEVQALTREISELRADLRAYRAQP